jgi:mono/diheme cytochrome c family protein
MTGIRSYLPRILLGGLALFALIQLVPYGRAHANPTPTKSAVLASPQAREIFANACADCHSYKTKWPWYTNVAPVSWLVTHDVDGGRNALNLSTWDKAQVGVDDVAEKIKSGEMPPLQYKISPNHAKARLSDKQKAILIASMRQLYASDPPAGIKQGEGG